MSNEKPKLEAEGRSYWVYVHPSRVMDNGRKDLSLWAYSTPDGNFQRTKRCWVQWRAEDPVQSWPCWTWLRSDELEATRREKESKGYKLTGSMMFHDVDIITAWNYIKGNVVDPLSDSADPLVLVDAIDDICRNAGHPHDYIDRALEAMRGLTQAKAMQRPQGRRMLSPGILAW